MSQDFGSHLKHEREMRGISLEEIAASTKIQLRFLQALETNQFDALPGEVFVKGFIKSYGKTIGCNVEDLISAYDESVGSHRQNADQIEQDLEDQRRHSRSSSVRINLLGVAALVAVLAVGVWYLNAPQSPSLPESEDSMLGEVPASEIVMENRSAPAMAGPEQKPSSLLKEPAADSPTRTGAGDLPGKPIQAPEQTIFDNGLSNNEKGAIIQTIQDQLIQNVSDGSESFSETLVGLRLVIQVSDNSWFNLKIDNSREMDFITSICTTERWRVWSTGTAQSSAFSTIRRLLPDPTTAYISSINSLD